MTETVAKVIGRNLSISTKQAAEICKFIRGKPVKKSKELLSKVAEGKLAVPFTRFNRDMGHRKGKIAAGRYPKRASLEIIKLLNSLEANAQNKGLDSNSIYIKKIVANKASTPWHFGRLRRRKMKRTHIEIVAEELQKK